MLSGHAIPHHLYADDSELYLSFASGDSAGAVIGLQLCFASAQSWMLTNKLKLNPDKTEFLLIRNERQWSKYHPVFPIELFSVKPNPAKSARNLGSNIWQKFHFLLTNISNVQLMLVPYLGSAVHVLLPWSKWDKNYLQLLMYLVVLIIDLTKLTVFRIDWPTLWQSHLLLHVVLHCFIPFICYQYNLESSSRSVCWPTKPCVKNSLFIFTLCLLHHSHPVHWDQAKELVCWSLGCRPT